MLMFFLIYIRYVVNAYRGMNGSRSHTPDPLSPEASGSPIIASQRGQGQGRASPTTQRIKAIGVPTPLAISSPIRRYTLLWHFLESNREKYRRKLRYHIHFLIRNKKR